MLDKMRHYFVMVFVAAIVLLSGVLLYMIWLEPTPKDMFAKAFGSYFVVIFSSIVVMKLLDYLEKKVTRK